VASIFESPAAALAARWETAAGSSQSEPVAGSCAVAPLDAITDPAALRLEASTNVVDVADMRPAAARALDRFEARVASAGGTMVLKSAYRPAAYQRHLQNVWYKWMNELRNNQEPACQDLRTQVQEEFTRHLLIDTQPPVGISDHTRGIAFDATVELPPNARFGRRRLTLDGLAHLAGLLRPAIITDPVHFKYFGGTRWVAVRRRRNA
jgi:D-alanyl-D-alanine carboxypeptidase